MDSEYLIMTTNFMYIIFVRQISCLSIFRKVVFCVFAIIFDYAKIFSHLAGGGSIVYGDLQLPNLLEPCLTCKLVSYVSTSEKNNYFYSEYKICENIRQINFIHTNLGLNYSKQLI